MDGSGRGSVTKTTRGTTYFSPGILPGVGGDFCREAAEAIRARRNFGEKAWSWQVYLKQLEPRSN